MNLAFKDRKYRAILNDIDLVYADGIGVVWAAKFLKDRQLEKVTGRDWIHDFCALAVNHNLRLYILAGKPGIAKAAQKNLEQQYPGLQIAGSQPGYFDEYNTPKIISEINRAAPHVLLVGMGVPQQEIWLAAHRDQIDAPVCWAVGALFDYVAGVEPPVPGWLNRLNLEWFWRLLIDPIGKWQRYLIGNPLFLYRILLQKLGLQLPR
jgi:N-acetylglucosaminyldiphosphoundecaprenol N-acetyl-beta-D-mannosaminyltransferase